MSQTIRLRANRLSPSGRSRPLLRRSILHRRLAGNLARHVLHLAVGEHHVGVLQGGPFLDELVGHQLGLREHLRGPLQLRSADAQHHAALRVGRQPCGLADLHLIRAFEYPPELVRLGRDDADRMHRMLRDEAVDRSRFEDAPLADDHQIVGSERDLAHQVGAEQHRPALASVEAAQFAHPFDALGVEAVHRLVQHEIMRIAQQRRRNREPLAHAQRE